MKMLTLLMLLGMMLVNVACVRQNSVQSGPAMQTAAERQLLVTFVDRSINRSVAGNLQDHYLARGQYNNSSWSERFAAQLAERYDLQFVAQWPMSELGLSCVVYAIAEDQSLPQVIERLHRDDSLSVVQPMQRFKTLATPKAEQSTYSDPYLPLQSSFQKLGIDQWHKTATGRGIRIAVIDSGVDAEHPDLQGQISYQENMVPEPNNHDLLERHGTAVAGILSAKAGNGIGIAGIAPDAEVLAFRACWAEQPDGLAAQCNSFTLALALNQALRMESQIINLSLSGPDDPLLGLLIKKALQKGVIVVAAVPEQQKSDGFPASMDGVLAVGRGGEHTTPMIVASGQDILTTTPRQSYDFMTGSSFATPQVSGISALLLQQHPGWHVNEIKQQLLQLFSMNLSASH